MDGRDSYDVLSLNWTLGNVKVTQWMFWGTDTATLLVFQTYIPADSLRTNNDTKEKQSAMIKMKWGCKSPMHAQKKLFALAHHALHRHIHMHDGIAHLRCCKYLVWRTQYHAIHNDTIYVPPTYTTHVHGKFFWPCLPGFSEVREITSNLAHPHLSCLVWAHRIWKHTCKKDLLRNVPSFTWIHLQSSDAWKLSVGCLL